MNKLSRIIAIGLAVAMPVAIAAQGDDQSATRENPKADNSASLSRTATSYPKYIRQSANHIDLNGDDWSTLAGLFACVDSMPVTIVHIGDSHLQAGISTNVTRHRLGEHFGRLRGRGLMIPFRLAGTNQPTDYSITSSSTFLQSRLLKMPWPTDMSFTGIGISPSSRNFNLTVKASEPFNTLIVFYTGRDISLQSAISGGEVASFVSELDERALSLTFVDNYTNLTLNFNAPTGTTIHGISAEHSSNGLAYHVIGNNGAAYSSYRLVGGMGSGVAELAPDLVILSLGTNEAFGRVVDSEVRMQIDALVADIRLANSEAKILLVTPSECQRKTTKRGRRGRKTTSFSVNAKVKQVADIIRAYGRDNHIPVYDWYEVAGGAGSSAKWLADRTLNTDRIHLTQGGYQLQGDLFADALIDALMNNLLQSEK